MPDFIDELLDQLTARGGPWPPVAFRKAWETVRRWRAFLESDRDRLREQAGWSKDDREYKVDPLGERIAEAWADHLFGEDPTFTPADDADDDNLTAIIDGNDLPDELRSAAETCVGEGEVWWRVAVDDELSDVPLIEFHSRASVAPLFIGRRLAAVALVTILEGKGTQDGNARPVYRHFEIHVDGALEHHVFRGSKNRIGVEVDLEQHPETAGLLDRWDHGLDGMLMGRIVNKRGRDFTLGRSDFARIRDQLLDLNEAETIGAENVRLTAKKRITLPANSPALRSGTREQAMPVAPGPGQGFTNPEGPHIRFAAGEDVIPIDPIDVELGKAANAPFTVLEYSFDAQPLIDYRRDKVETALTRVAMTPQWLGLTGGDGDGYAATGTALRLRLLPTNKGGRGKGRAWDETMPRFLMVAAQLHSLPVELGGLGQSWTDPDTPPSVERADPLPADEVEDAQVDSTLINARVASRRNRIKRRHPDWTDKQVDEELELIREDDERDGAAGVIPRFP